MMVDPAAQTEFRKAFVRRIERKRNQVRSRRHARRRIVAQQVEQFRVTHQDFVITLDRIPCMQQVQVEHRIVEHPASDNFVERNAQMLRDQRNLFERKGDLAPQPTVNGLLTHT